MRSDEGEGGGGGEGARGRFSSSLQDIPIFLYSNNICLMTISKALDYFSKTLIFQVTIY